ncbi:MAG TPA: hypothetical protein VE715_12955 [Blastocatellia bacterium]|nr:hypothetical protein [Blastocatellia bacterium]
MKKRSAIFAAALIVLVLFGSGCNPTERDTVATPSPTVMPAMTPPEAHPSPSASAAPEWLAAGATNRVAEITGAPNAFLGKTVTVVAEVDEVYGPRAFTLNGEGAGSSGAKGAGKDLLTLVPKVGGFPNVDAQWKEGKARVTGVVQRMIPKDVEREIGWVLPLNLESKFRGRPVLIVRSVERLAK